jgi:TRAP-type mannitol/chloroaromatic compound transport system permease small subunit
MVKPSSAYLGIIRVIDSFTEYLGILLACILVPLLIVPNVYEVISRYVFSDPTIWALDATTMVYGALFMLGSAYALLKGAHVRTDMLWEGFSNKTKGVIDSIAFIVFFLPTMAVLTYSSWDDFLYSMSIGERSNSGAWQPIIWPFRGVITVTFALLFVQGISELMKSLWAARTGEFLVHHEKIEV